nr:MAG TPA: hypothetical protein [Caudoviricetes sp.]
MTGQHFFKYTSSLDARQSQLQKELYELYLLKPSS